MMFKKITPPVLITALLILFIVGYGFLFSIIPLPIPIRILLVLIFAYLVWIAIKVLGERIKEIRREDKDDFSKY